VHHHVTRTRTLPASFSQQHHLSNRILVTMRQ
jgi:hypothetical protein